MEPLTIAVLILTFVVFGGIVISNMFGEPPVEHFDYKDYKVETDEDGNVK